MPHFWVYNMDYICNTKWGFMVVAVDGKKLLDTCGFPFAMFDSQKVIQ